MPHQCLNCGRIIPKGSDEILKGCKVCGGRKFIYVEQPLSERERLRLRDNAERIREDLLKKSDNELVELIREKGVSRATKDMGEGWVNVREGDLKGTSSYEVVPPKRETRVHPTAQELLKEVDKRTSSKFGKKQKEEEKKKRTIKHPKRRRELKERRRKEPSPDVVTIVESGVYEIDVKKLLEKSPIIVQKDGSYLIHLPSLFEMEKEE